MALIQGGYARRIKPGHHIRAVSMVGAPAVYMTNSFTMMHSACFCKGCTRTRLSMSYFNELCVLFLGNLPFNPSIYSHRALVEYHDALPRLGSILIW